MTPPLRAALRVAACLVFVTAFGAAQAVDFTTSRGDTLSLAPIDAMDCDDMEIMIARIDSTRYRDNGPVPRNEADRILYDYEMELAKAYFHGCIQSGAGESRGLQLMRRALPEE